MFNQSDLCAELQTSLNRDLVHKYPAPLLDELRQHVGNPNRVPISFPETASVGDESRRLVRLPKSMAGTLTFGAARDPFLEDVFAIDLVGRCLENRVPVVYVQSGSPDRRVLSLLLCSLAGASCAMLRDGIFERSDTMPGSLGRAYESIRRSSFSLLSPKHVHISGFLDLLENEEGHLPVIIFDRSAFGALSTESWERGPSEFASILREIALAHQIFMIAFQGSVKNAEECGFMLHHDKGPLNDCAKYFLEPTRFRATFKRMSSAGEDVYCFHAFLSKMRLEDALE